MEILVWVVVLPHPLAPKVLGVFFDLSEAEEAARDADAFAVVDRAELHT